MALAVQNHAEVVSADYETDVIAWAKEQVRLLRSGQFSLLDIEHIVEEIEDVAKSERRELRNRMAVLLAHLLKWQYQADRRGNSWRRTINVQRDEITAHIKSAPSLKPDLQDSAWWDRVWSDALGIAVRDTGLSYEAFPEVCPWVVSEVLSSGFWPGESA